MKLKSVLLRWYKSFHLNYRGEFQKGEKQTYRPWNVMSPSYAGADVFPFIEIPIEDDITTVVGANESGKSHLLNAITKVVRGCGIDPSDAFERTDLCHYAGVRTRNVEAWPNVGLQFTVESDTEATAIANAIGTQTNAASFNSGSTFALILAPDDKGKIAQLFLEPNLQAFALDSHQLDAVRVLLPSVQFIDSKALLASQIPLARLIAAYGDTEFSGIGLLDRRAVEQAAGQIQSLTPPPSQQPTPADYPTKLEAIKKSLLALVGDPPSSNSLEMLLFKEILGINVETLKYLYHLTSANRGYVEGQIAKWNEEINDRLNLSHFWSQDEQFSLTVNYKDAVVYFEIHDKTDSIYTFDERSSGLKFFLSYYIQAKAMEMSSRNRNSIILMDEPDSALSILGQRNLLAVFESLVSPESSNQTCQLIYTTHSPYLINRNFPRRIRVVKKEDAEEGTQYIEQARARRYEPVRTALGIDSAPSLFLGADNILLEGPTDQFLLTELIRVFATPMNVGEFLDLNAVVIVSADGVGNIQNVLEQSRWADEPIPPTAVLVDSDKAAAEVIDNISNPKGKKPLIDRSFVAAVGELVKPFSNSAAIVTSEDLVPRAIYAAAISAYIKRWLPDTVKSHAADINSTLGEATFGKDGLVEATKSLFKKVRPEFGTDFDKMGVLQEVVLIAQSRLPSLKTDQDLTDLRRNVISLCDWLRDALARSRAVTAKYSTTQAVKRIIHDFNRLNKDNVPVTALQKLFRRLEREVAPIGLDGEHFLHTITQYLTDMEKLRAAGQTRIVGVKWQEWRTRIDAIKSNPLAAEPPTQTTVAQTAPAAPSQSTTAPHSVDGAPAKSDREDTVAVQHSASPAS
jgi:predicted ATPase